MTTAEVVRFQPRDSMPAKLQYAKALADSGLLPAAFRKQPANVLYAVEYGDMLGLPAMAAITGIHVIEGKPTASAGLISALVRRAGHKLRVTGDAKGATCQIVRADDPGYTFEVTFTFDDAKAAGLTGKDVWKKYAASMLKARAITQCARDACEEALYGLHYTPEELGADVDGDGEPVTPAPARADTGGIQDAVEVVTDPAWLDKMLTDAAGYADAATGIALWHEIGAKRDAGQCTQADANRLADLIKARKEDLERPVEDVAPAAATVVPPLDPADPWAMRIDDASDGEEIGEVAAEFRQLCEAGEIQPARAVRIRAAIDAKAAQFGQEAA